MQKKFSNGLKHGRSNRAQAEKCGDGIAISPQGMAKHCLGGVWVKLQPVIGTKVADFAYKEAKVSAKNGASICSIFGEFLKDLIKGFFSKGL